MDTVFIIIVLLFLTALFFFIKLLIREKKNKSSGVWSVANSTTLLLETGYTFDNELTLEENFVDYLCKYAEKRDLLPDITAEELYDFFMRNRESIRLSFVIETRQKLIINSVQKVFEKAVEKFKKQTI